jgi:hypothetical protein
MLQYYCKIEIPQASLCILFKGYTSHGPAIKAPALTTQRPTAGGPRFLGPGVNCTGSGGRFLDAVSPQWHWRRHWGATPGLLEEHV